MHSTQCCVSSRPHSPEVVIPATHLAIHFRPVPLTAHSGVRLIFVRLRAGFIYCTSLHIEAAGTAVYGFPIRYFEPNALCHQRITALMQTSHPITLLNIDWQRFAITFSYTPQIPVRRVSTPSIDLPLSPKLAASSMSLSICPRYGRPTERRTYQQLWSR